MEPVSLTPGRWRPDREIGGDALEKAIEGICWYVAFLFSVTLHEAAHAWMAKLGGDLTAYHSGQVTLDPLPHIRREPFGALVFPIISIVAFQWPFGYASSPYDPEWADRHPRRAALMSFAGPFSNLALALCAGALIRIGLLSGHFEIPNLKAIGLTRVVVSPTDGVWTGAALLLSMMFSLNLILAILNLIPFPPLDGGAALGLLLPKEKGAAYRRLVNQPAFAWIGLIVAWQVCNAVLPYAFFIAIATLYPDAKWR